jgi:integrase
MSVNKRSNGKWLVQVRDRNAQWFPSKTFETKREAEDYEDELKNLRRQGVKVKSRDLRAQTLAQYWLRWSDECRSDTSDGWKSSQNQMWTDHIEPVLGLIKLVELERADVALLLSKMKNKGLGGQTRLHIYNLLHNMMEASVEIYEVRENNPVVKALKPEVPTVKQKFLKPVIAKGFLDDVREHPLGAAFWIMIHCGLRTGEIQALRRENIDMDDASITIHEQWVRKERRFGPLKNREPLTVPMPIELVRYLKDRLDIRLKPRDFIVTKQDGGMMSHSVLYKALKALCAKHRLPMLSPHELRHTCSELWVEQGATQQDLRRLFNHASEKSTERYIHKTDERLRLLSQKGNRAHIRRVK